MTTRQAHKIKELEANQQVKCGECAHYEWADDDDYAGMHYCTELDKVMDDEEFSCKHGKKDK